MGSLKEPACNQVVRPRKKLFSFKHPHLRDLDWGWAFQGLGLGTPLGWALKEILRLGTPLGRVGHSRENLGLGALQESLGWALQRVSGVAHSRRFWQGDSGVWGWALQGDSGVALQDSLGWALAGWAL